MTHAIDELYPSRFIRENYEYFRWLTLEERGQIQEDEREIAKEFECRHPSTSVRFFYTKTNQIRYKLQCNECGASRPIAKKELNRPDLATPLEERDVSPWQYAAIKALPKFKANRMKWLNLAHQRAAARQDEYSSYLLSNDWKTKRGKVLKRAGGICEGCGDKPAVEVHHLTYDRIYREMLFDLVAVCKSCHDQLHPWKEANDD